MYEYTGYSFPFTVVVCAVFAYSPTAAPLPLHAVTEKDSGKVIALSPLTVLLQNKNIIALVVPGRVSTLKRGMDELLVSH